MIDAAGAARTQGLAGRVAFRLAALGDWMQWHPRPIQTIQWCVVAAYALLVVVPAFLPLPPTMRTGCAVELTVGNQP